MSSTLRSRNEDRCAHLLDGARALELDDLAWYDIGDVHVDDDTLAALIYMRDVEGFTDRDLVGFTAHSTTLRDPLVRRFLDVWRAEEAGHADALDRYLTAYGHRTGRDVPLRQLPPPAHAPVHERVLAHVRGPFGAMVTTAHMAWGAANELLTLNGYRLLARRTDDSVLRELLTRIAAQEARHFSFYLLQTEWRLAESRLARTPLPNVLRKSWTPVGVGYG